MFSRTDSVRVVDWGDGMTEERKVSLGAREYPVLHALLNKMEWVDLRVKKQWSALEVQLKGLPRS